MTDYDRTNPRPGDPTPGRARDPRRDMTGAPVTPADPVVGAPVTGSTRDDDHTTVRHGDVKYGYRKTGMNTSMMVLGGLILLAGIAGLIFWSMGVGDRDVDTTASVPPAVTTDRAPGAPVGPATVPNRTEPAAPAQPVTPAPAPVTPAPAPAQ